ncbi:putative histone acetyltransferase [Lyophyllum shimeji]|uniref:Histone acetyltransferase n=1 Tax=Lyophyllum shimeji TaxID=47721 RepID=A0A9P3PR52_LYOSH|nr:putative histone acetyltransferase [Lyophyllum shimeji]
MDSNEQNMQYGRMPPPERRDSTLDSNGSTPFQTHQGLGQALGPHIPGLSQNGGPQQAHPGPPSSHSPLFTVLKRRRDADDGDTFDMDGTGQGAKHWTDEEKSKLFSWLMGPGQDEHWNSLRATKNSCLRECAIEVFGSKKTYQALKGCYERNFNLFKQIYAFESFHAHSGDLSTLNEADRLREYERRLQAARKAGCDVGNVTARTIDHWHRVGWYELFYRRWHGDPATTRPVHARNTNASGSNQHGGDDADMDDDPPQASFPDSVMISNGINPSMPHDRTHPNPMNYINPQTLRDSVVPQPSISPITGASGSGQQQNGNVNGAPMVASTSAAAPANPDQAVMNLTITQGMLSTCLQYLQVQTQTGKMKLEYMRRREEREEKESVQRRESERLRMEREAAEYEHNKQKLITQQKTERALALLENPVVDESVKKAAGDYLKKLFTAD